MVSVNIMIKKEAYDYLTSLKGDKSYSDVILEFKKNNQTTLKEFAGRYKYSPEYAQTRKAQIRKEREQANDRTRYLRNN